MLSMREIGFVLVIITHASAIVCLLKTDHRVLPNFTATDSATVAPPLPPDNTFLQLILRRQNPDPNRKLPSAPGDSRAPFGVSRKPFGVSREPFGISQEPFGVSQTPSGVSRNTSGVPRKPFGMSQNLFGVSRNTFGMSQNTFGRPQKPLGRARNCDFARKSPFSSFLALPRPPNRKPAENRSARPSRSG